MSEELIKLRYIPKSKGEKEPGYRLTYPDDAVEDMPISKEVANHHLSLSKAKKQFMKSIYEKTRPKTKPVNLPDYEAQKEKLKEMNKNDLFKYAVEVGLIEKIDVNMTNAQLIEIVLKEQYPSK